MEKTQNNKAWFLVLPVLVLVAFSAIIPLMTVVNYAFNDTFGKQPLKFGEPQSSLDGPRVPGFQPDDLVAAGGLPVSFSVVCENGDEEPLTGVYPIKIPAGQFALIPLAAATTSLFLMADTDACDVKFYVHEA